ncbi:sensor histidine kinase [Paucibacter soli]|uniref:sensor histidine kinase n=1 Tax=Paucibacter soli TaxID=3133433 RepID=UPI0030AACFA4
MSELASGSGGSSSNKPPLRRRLLRHVLGPLLLTWALGSLLALWVASYFTQRAFDRAMLDDALLLARHLEAGAQGLQLAMSTEDLGTVLYDQSERVFYAVHDGGGRLIVGSPGLLPEALRADAAPPELQYLDQDYRGRAVRTLVLRREAPQPAWVLVAQTTVMRQRMRKELLLFALPPQVLLLVGLAGWLRHRIGRDVRPLAALQQALQARPPSDLSALPAELKTEAPSRELEQLGYSIDGLLARVEASMRAQREFAGNVAHELRTPLAGVRAAAEYGLAQSEPQRWREQLQAVLASAVRASHLVDQLLALALADESRGRLRLQPLVLGELVRELLLRYLARADQAGVELGASGLEGGEQVLGDAGLIEGMLGNLLDNALRYGRAASGPSSISVELQPDPAGLRLCVVDNGPGIPAAQRSAVRQRWAQGEALCQAPALGQGTGLGLAIVERYASLLGAGLSLEPGPGGQGLRACLVFPPALPDQAAKG